VKRTYLGAAVAAMAVLVEWTGPSGRTQASQASTAGDPPPKELSNQEMNDAFVQVINDCANLTNACPPDKWAYFSVNLTYQKFFAGADEKVS